MDCTDAQQIVSAALDREPVDTDLLTEAKDHCRRCEACTGFIRTLVALKSASAAAPPADLPDRIMARIRAEDAESIQAANGAVVASSQREATASETARLLASLEAQPEPEATATSRVPSGIAALMERAMHPRNRRATLTWAATAAAVIAVVSVVSVGGISRMFSADGTGGAPMTTQYTLQPESAKTAAAPSSRSDSGAAATSADMATTAAPSGFIVLSEAVYAAAGPDSTVNLQGLKVVGSTNTALTVGSPTTTLDILGTGDPNRVYIAAADGSLLAFDRITRLYAGRTYVLQSGPIETLTGNPSLPASIERPTNSDGTPSLEPANPADPDAGVYVVKGSDASSGIVLAPGAEAKAGPDWTYWIPARN